MAYAARCEVASVRLRVWRVTTVTAVMRVDAGGNRQCSATAQASAVTRHTAVLWPRRARHVLRVIEFHVEALFEIFGKDFARRIVAVDRSVANRAHGNVRRGELRQVTAGACLVSGKVWTCRVISAAMTIVTADGCVL